MLEAHIRYIRVRLDMHRSVCWDTETASRSAAGQGPRRAIYASRKSVSGILGSPAICILFLFNRLGSGSRSRAGAVGRGCALGAANCPACRAVFPRLFGGGPDVSKKSNDFKPQG